MGYTTNFSGEFVLSEDLSLPQERYLRALSDTRRMKRDPVIAGSLPDPLRVAVDLPIGEEGCYFVGGGGFAGQDRDSSILDYNEPPRGQPGLWCQWEPSSGGSSIVWNGAEKFYNYLEWLRYLLDHFLLPWGYELTGEVDWSGEDPSDQGKIVCSKDGTFKTYKKVWSRKGEVWSPSVVQR